MSGPERKKKRAIILGNGPSLEGFDFDRLNGFDVFGMNAAYRHWDRIGWYPQFYSCLDTVVGLSHRDEIERLIIERDALGIRSFLLRSNLCEAIDVDLQQYVINFDELVLELRLFSAPTITTGSHTAAWAASLGYREIFLLGIDCNYVEFVEGARHVSGIELELGRTPSKNPNYFFADYQQSGDRYNVPNPDREVHLESWREVAELLPSHVKVLNANTKSRVDAFDFCTFDSVEQGEEVQVISREEVLPYLAEFDQGSTHPKILVFDLTRRGDGSATGQLKETLFEGWSDDSYLQVFGSDAEPLRLDGPIEFMRSRRPDFLFSVSEDVRLLQSIDEFNPEVVFYRPTPDSGRLHEFVMKFLETSTLPLVVAIWDDWLQRMHGNGSLLYEPYTRDVHTLVQKASTAIAISDELARTCQVEFGQEFSVFANGVDAADWVLQKRESSEGIVVRYAGSLASDMTLESVVDIAGCIESLSEKANVGLEIKTTNHWFEENGSRFDQFSATVLITENFEPDAYRNWLMNADVVIIAYNFDPITERYAKNSLANKLPECLASGAAVLAYGPEKFATMSRLQEAECAEIVTVRDSVQLLAAIENLVNNKALRSEMGSAARLFAFSRFDAATIRERFQSMLVHVTRESEPRRDNTVAGVSEVTMDESKRLDSTAGRAVQMLQWLANEIAARPLTTAFVLFVVVLLAVMPFLVPNQWENRLIYWGGALLVMFIVCCAATLMLANRALHQLLDEIDARDNAVRRGIRDAVVPLRTRLAALEQRVQSSETGSSNADNVQLPDERQS